jgi:ABC-type nitrate/sulfonate/bicarbonate transport system ATPase subunit
VTKIHANEMKVDTSSAPPRLTVRDLRKTFDLDRTGEVLAVDGIDLDLRAGEFVTIVGPSGCGKSTLLNIVAGLEQPSSGQILIDNRPAENRRGSFAYMFQKDLLFPWRTIRDNVAVGLEVQGVPRREARERAMGLLRQFGLEGFAHKFPAQLSGGMRQRAALMRTLLCNRDVLLLDEPFGALDAMTRGVMQEWLLGIWEADHRTILFITHDIEEAVFLSDRVLMMSARPGRIKGEVEVGLRRPRTHEILTSPDFTRLKKHILDQMYDEGLKAVGSA